MNAIMASLSDAMTLYFLILSVYLSYILCIYSGVKGNSLTVSSKLNKKGSIFIHS